MALTYEQLLGLRLVRPWQSFNAAFGRADSTVSGAVSNGNSGGALISRDGTRAVFGSSARTLVSPQSPANVFPIYVSVIAAPATVKQRKFSVPRNTRVVPRGAQRIG